MNGPVAMIYHGVIATLLAAGVIGIWSMKIEVTAVSTKLVATMERLDRRERVVDLRLDRLEQLTWPTRTP